MLYPFGHGLSYTTFEYKGLQVTHNTSFGGALQYAVSVRVRNTGEHSVYGSAIYSRHDASSAASVIIMSCACRMQT